MKCISSICTMALVAACGGGSGGDSGAEKYSDLRATYFSINNQIDFNAPITASTLPTTGSANYEGSIYINTPGNITVAGELELAFDFANADFDGKATDIVDSDGYQYDGELDVTNGFIDRSADPNTSYAFIGDIDGTVTDPDDNAYTLDAFIVGDFFGNNEEYVAGVIRGDVDSDLGDFEVSGSNSGFRAEK